MILFLEVLNSDLDHFKFYNEYSLLLLFPSRDSSENPRDQNTIFS